MKKLVLVLALAFAGIMTANAQVWIGGGLGTSVQKGLTTIDLAPEVGYCINDQWQVALGIDYGMATGSGYTANVLYLQPYVRYVGGTIGHKFSLFVDLTGDFSLLDAPKGDYAVMLQPGIAWQATEKFTAAFRFAKIGYDHNIYGTDGFLLQGVLATSRIGIYYNF